MTTVKFSFLHAFAVSMLAALMAPTVWADDKPGDANAATLAELQIEKRRQQSAALIIQENIRTKTREAAGLGGVAGNEGMVSGMGQNESLFRELAVAEAQFLAMKVRKKAIEHRLAHPQDIPVEVLVSLNPEFTALHTQKSMLQQRKEELLKNFFNKEDPRLKEMDRQIALIDEKIQKLIGNSDDGGMSEMVQKVLFQSKVELYNLEQYIRIQEILVKELNQRYVKQLDDSAHRATLTADISFDVTQLAQTNKTIDRIEEQILETSEQEKRVTPTAGKDPKELDNRALLLRLLETLERIEHRLTALEQDNLPRNTRNR